MPSAKRLIYCSGVSTYLKRRVGVDREDKVDLGLVLGGEGQSRVKSKGIQMTYDALNHHPR
jgi:hypothetical protein